MTEKEKLAEKRSGYNRKYYAAQRLRLYGLSQEQFDGMLSAQNAACAICHTKESKGRNGTNTFHVDHCHSSGVVRGLLCNRCNMALGLFDDNTALLMRATEYLAASRTIQ